MDTEKTIQQIREEIATWNTIREKEIALNQLTSGYGVEITRQEYQNWIPILEGREAPHINLYLASNDYGLTFFLVDSVTDGSGDDEQYQMGVNLFEKRFYRNQDHSNIPSSNFSIPKINIDEPGVLKAAFQWFLYSRNWFAQKLNQSREIVRVFSLPFDDFKTVFENEEVVSAFCFFCLENLIEERGEETICHREEISVFVCSKIDPVDDRVTDDHPRIYANVGVPRPPFKIVTDHFGLLS